MNILFEKEKALAKNIAFNQEENYEMVEEIILDFKEMDIEKFEYLKKLTDIVLDKKRECKIINPDGYLYSQVFEKNGCEMEAIDLLAGDDSYFAHKYRSLVSNKNYVDDNLYENELYNDDEILYNSKALK